ncbi:MAG: hypothetical protein Q8T13_04955 [Acidobacteriota bacterium]|nr:hypothetical protein [Acidobacteriota bacterium]
MPLKKVLASKAELDALPEATRGLYVEKDGKFILDLDGDDDVTGLKGALDKERENGKKLAKELQQLRTDLAGTDPVKAKAAIKRLQELEDKELIEAGEVEKLVTKRVAALEADKNAEIERLKGELGGRDARLSELLIDNQLRQVATKVKVRDTAVDDFIARGQRLYKLKDGKAVPMNGEEIAYSKKKANEPMPMEEWAADLVANAPHLFEGSGGGGSQQSAGGGGKAFTITREEARDSGKYRQMKDEAARAGQDLQIVG